jgi:hypothetical protein
VDDSEVWMQAEVFERDIGLVAEGQAVEILCEAYPGSAVPRQSVFHPAASRPRHANRARARRSRQSGPASAGGHVRHCHAADPHRQSRDGRRRSAFGVAPRGR